MNTRLVFAAALVLVVPLAYAQDTTQPPAAQNVPATPPPTHHSTDRDWNSRHSWNHTGSPPHEEEHSRVPEHLQNHGQEDGHSNTLLPFGMWWKNPEVVARISLTAEQEQRINDFFRQSRMQLFHMNAALREEQQSLAPLLNTSSFNEEKAMEQINKIADTRADLEKANARMLLNIRGVLTADQWEKLRGHDHSYHHPEGSMDSKGAQAGPKSN